MSASERVATCSEIGMSVPPRRDLARVAALATRAKQVILAAPFNGDLTADWREAYGASLEPTTVGAVADASSFPKMARKEG